MVIPPATMHANSTLLLALLGTTVAAAQNLCVTMPTGVTAQAAEMTTFPILKYQPQIFSEAATVQSPHGDAAATVQGPRQLAATVQGPRLTAALSAATVQGPKPTAAVYSDTLDSFSSARDVAATVQGPKRRAAAATVQSPRRRTAFAEVLLATKMQGQTQGSRTAMAVDPEATVQGPRERMLRSVKEAAATVQGPREVVAARATPAAGAVWFIAPAS